MATSGSTDYTLNTREIITTALELVGARALGDTPSAEETDLALTHLNLLLKTWSADPKLFLLTETSVVLVASTASYSLPAARRVREVRRRASGIDTPLDMLSRDDYFAIPNKAGTGTPNSAYFDPQRATRTLYVWPAPTTAIAAAYTLRYTYERVIEDADALANDPDVPQEWLEALAYSLAARIAIPLKRHLADAAGVAELKQRAADLYAQLTAQDEESTSVFIQPHC